MFVVDATAPTVSVSGISDGGRYRTDVQTVSVIPADDGGELDMLVICTVDESGNVIKELVNLSGEDLRGTLEANGGIITFELGEGLFQNVRIICADSSTDAERNVNTFEQTIEDISVSNSGFMIFWANRPLRYAAMAAIVIAAVACWYFLAGKKAFARKRAKK